MSGLPDTRAVSISTAGYEDGLGRRSVRFDREVGGMLECLHLRPELWAFETSLRNRADAIGSLEDERFVRIRGIERGPHGVVVVSELIAGQRLVDIIEIRQRDDSPAFGLDAAVGFLLQALPALSTLHSLSTAHGAVAPGRILVTPASQIVLLDGIYGAALERLNLSRRAMWLNLGILAPPFAGAPRFDRQTDVTQAAYCALVLAVGRHIEGSGDPSWLVPLLEEVRELAEIRAGGAFAAGVEKFFAAALPLNERVPALSADDAAAGIEGLAAMIGEEGCHTAFAHLTRFEATLFRAAAPVEDEFEAERTRRNKVKAAAKPAAPVPAPAPKPAPPAAVPAAAKAAPRPAVPAPPKAAPRPAVPAVPKAAPPPPVVVRPPAPLAVAAPPPLPPAPPIAPPAPVSTPAPAVPETPAAAVAPEPPPKIVEPVTPVAPVMPMAPVAPIAPIAPPIQVDAPAPIAPAPIPPAPIASAAPVAAPVPVAQATPVVPVAPVVPIPTVPLPAALAPPIVPLPAPPIAAAPPTPITIAPPAAVRVRAEPPTGYTPVRPEPEASLRALPFVDRSAVEESRPFPWKLAAAALIVLSVGIVAGRTYLQGKDEPAPTPTTTTTTTTAPVAVATSAAPTAGRGGSLAIDTQPSGAKVSIDGVDAGVTPLKLDDVSPGRHAIVVTTDNATIKRTVRVEAGRLVTLDIPVYSGWVVVFSPIPLDIATGGTTLGNTDTGKIILPPGQHVLTLTNRELGFSETRSVEIHPGEERPLNVEPKGFVNVNAHPWAEVWIDGKKAGDTPIANLPVLLGTRVFLFKHPQYGERRVTTTITSKPAALTVDLTKP